jgi:hypothetical protein
MWGRVRRKYGGIEDWKGGSTGGKEKGEGRSNEAKWRKRKEEV